MPELDITLIDPITYWEPSNKSKGDDTFKYKSVPNESPVRTATERKILRKVYNPIPIVMYQGPIVFVDPMVSLTIRLVPCFFILFDISSTPLRYVVLMYMQ